MQILNTTFEASYPDGLKLANAFDVSCSEFKLHPCERVEPSSDAVASLQKGEGSEMSYLLQARARRLIIDHLEVRHHSATFFRAW